MKALAHILVAVALLAAVPLVTTSNVVFNFLVFALLIALVGQGWNLLGGYGGQYSFGHAAFFGTGAYVTAVLQVRYGLNAWPAFGLGGLRWLSETAGCHCRRPIGVKLSPRTLQQAVGERCWGVWSVPG